MSARSRIVATAAVAASLAAAPPTSISHVRRHHAPAKLLCEIPPRDYVGTTPRRGATLTFRGVLVRAVDLPPELGAAHSRVDYLLAASRLGDDHCSISRVALAVWDDGSWSLSFRADQNPDWATYVEGALPGSSVPSQAPLILPGSSGPRTFTDHIKRNQFTVRARGLAYVDTTAEPNAGPGRPVFFDLSSGPFWVQRRSPLFPKFEGVDSHVGASFNRVDQVEIELTYR